MVRGGIRPEEGVRGVMGRGKIDGDGVPGEWSARDRVSRKKFSHRETRKPQQMPRSARAIVVANNFDSHGFSGTGFTGCGKSSLFCHSERSEESLFDLTL